MRSGLIAFTAILIISVCLGGCSDDSPERDEPPAPLELPTAPEHAGVYGIANGCYSLQVFDGDQRLGFLRASEDGELFELGEDQADGAAKFLLRSADLATYLLYDEQGHYLTAPNPLEDDAEPEEAGDSDAAGDADAEQAPQPMLRLASLDSALTLMIDGFRSPAMWTFEASERDADRFQLFNVSHDMYFAADALVSSADEAAIVTLYEADGCAEFPELSVDAVGEVTARTWEDGDLYGFVDAHTHLLTNVAFGGGGMFHGAPFHPLGVEHALSSCDGSHGVDGRRDIVGYFYDGDQDLEADTLIPILSTAMTPDFNHHTDGYPTFTDWPNAVGSSTHQVQYYRWLERAWMSGLRLVVELSTSNSILCEFLTGIKAQTSLYSCNDMVGADRQLVAIRELERYIDALHGGPGEGWLRVVESPREAREVISAGKMAVVLGIETSNLFDCFLTPPPGEERCTPEMVDEVLDKYYEAGVRVIFPVHKYDNAFGAGDGSNGIIELGNFINSGHYSNFVEDCPFGRVGFDEGDVIFGGLNRPRDQFDAPPAVNMRQFATNPIPTLAPYISYIMEEEPLYGHCQNAGLTELGRYLIRAMMSRGMVIDIAHLSQQGVLDALEILEEEDYPAASTHGVTYDDRVFDIGGLVGTWFGGCADLEEEGAMSRGFLGRVETRLAHGLHPGVGFAFDMNGFAGQRRPRFGEQSRCEQPQPNPVTYPFRSYDGEVEFTEPWAGERRIDYNNEGLVHIGLIPELIEDIRLDGASDEDLEPLFRSAETWVRMWEASEAWAAEAGR